MHSVQLAGCVIQNQHGHILLIHRNNGKHVQWEIPGGKVDEGEAALTAAVRELQEELGVVVQIIKHLGKKGFSQGTRQWHYNWFHADIIEGEPAIMEPHIHDAFDFFSLEQLGTMADELSPNTANFLKEIHAGRIAF